MPSSGTVDILDKIQAKDVAIGVIGLGYVGLPLAIEFARAGFRTIGFDVDQEKVEKIGRGETYITDITDDELAEAVRGENLRATADFSTLRHVDAISICVPTPLRKSRDPDVSYIVNATETIAKYMKRGHLIVLESTTYPGTTEEVVLPELEKGGLKVGRDFFLAFSPERIDPGNPTYHTQNTPKVIGGVTEMCTKAATALYSHVIESIVPVSSPKVAEMVKLLENTFRAVNIGMVNELAIVCDKLGIDVWEVVDAAATKPFGFMPFYPGPGIGGHCIPVDPQYLSWKLRSMNYHTRFITLAEAINGSMPQYVVDKITLGLNRDRKAVSGSKLLVLGVAYKKNVGDVRESPALDVIDLLLRRGAEIEYNDPFVPELRLAGHTFRSVPLRYDRLGEYDCVVIISDHSVYDHAQVVAKARLVVDTKNATRNTGTNRNVIKL